jgi:3-hydroxyacyl-CoA dehydrogenase
MKTRVSKIACVGIGLVGRGWASVFSGGGFDVSIFDSRKGAAKKAAPTIRKLARFIQENHLSPSQTLGVVRPVSTLAEAVDGCDYVQESVFESYGAKTKVFKDIGNLNPKTIIASSTSSLSISKIQTAARNPSRCLSVHPLNPVYIMPAVEVVGGKRTSKEVVQTACDLMVSLGKVPIRLNYEVPGHVIDRLQAALWREALDLVARGVADANEIDKGVASGLGLRWAAVGPFLRAHLAGGEAGLEYYFEHIEPSHSHIWKDMASWKRAPATAKERALESVRSFASGMSYEELVAWRDELLLRLIGAKGNKQPRAGSTP